MNIQPKYCLATVTSQNYFQWTMTMIFSFLKNNPWFGGDIVVICKDLPPEMIGDLRLFDRLKIIEPSGDLLKKIDILVNEAPKFEKVSSRFFSLEIFSLHNYDKILFLDSDMIIVKSIEEIFSLHDSFYASAQLCYYKGKGRNGFTFHTELKKDDQTYFIENPVNTGFMLIDGNILNGLHYSGLCEMLNPTLWSFISLNYTDELVINRYFRDKITLLDIRYNYRARAARIFKEQENISIEDAKIIHFYSRFKPWNFAEVIASSANNLNWIKAYELWYHWYIEFLKFYHFQKKIIGITDNKTKE